jgi:hypothetical protein
LYNLGIDSYNVPNFGIDWDNVSLNDRRRTYREHNKDKKFNNVMAGSISTIINNNRELDHEDINRGHRFPHDRNGGACTSIKSY